VAHRSTNETPRHLTFDLDAADSSRVRRFWFDEESGIQKKDPHDKASVAAWITV
jgi:hypothetical protein